MTTILLSIIAAFYLIMASAVFCACKKYRLRVRIIAATFAPFVHTIVVILWAKEWLEELG